MRKNTSRIRFTITCSSHSLHAVRGTMKLLSTIVLFSLLGYVLADYLFEANLHSYLNPTHRQANDKCCRNNSFVSCEDDCRNKLHFCLRPMNFTATSTTAKCPLGNHTVSGIDDGFVYNQPGQNTDLSNPLIFTGDRWSGSFQLLVEVANVNTDGESQVVDVINIQYESLFPGEGIFGPLEFQGTYRIGSLEISFRVMCTGGFSGPDCTSPCSGDECSNICEHLMPCRNGGTCTSSGNDSYRCLCSDLYTGNNCEMLNEDETMSTAIMDVELESSGEIDDLFPNTTLETETPGPRGCKVSFVGCVAGGASAGVLLLLGVVAVVVFTILNLRDGRGHASVPDEHQRKGSVTTDLDYCQVNPAAEEWFDQISHDERGYHSIKVTSV